MLFPRVQRTRSARVVVVTGLGVVSAFGLGQEVHATGFREGRAAFEPVTLFDASRQRVRFAAETPLPDETLSGTPPPPRGERRRLDRAGRLLQWAAREAWRECGWDADPAIPLMLGTTGGGMALGETYYRQAIRQPNVRRGQAVRAVGYQARRQAAGVAASLGLTGPVWLIANACASGSNALGLAWEWVRSGRADRVLAGGFDALCELVFAGFDSLQALSPTTCRPFDAHRDGLSLGDGAAVFALETREAARARGARIWAEIAGYGAATDGHHLTQPHPEGLAAVTTMREACRVAGVEPSDIAYVNAHGTGTPLNDQAEAAAIRAWAGPAVGGIRVSSTKAGIGHLLGAAGAVEAAVCLLAMRGGWLPPMRSTTTPDPACVFPLVLQPESASLEHVLSNSFGFGGANATLVFRRCT